MHNHYDHDHSHTHGMRREGNKKSVAGAECVLFQQRSNSVQELKV